MGLPLILLVVTLAGLGALLVSGRVGAAPIITADEPDDTLIAESDIGRIVNNYIDWSNIKYFSEAEFPPDELSNADPELFAAIDAVRSALGAPLILLPDKGALARGGKHSRGSQHWIGDEYNNPVRKSTAVDLMAPEGRLIDAYNAALSVRVIGGIGLYPEANPRGYIHLDIRSYIGRPKQWMGVRGDGGWDYQDIDLSFVDRTETRRA